MNVLELSAAIWFFVYYFQGLIDYNFCYDLSANIFTALLMITKYFHYSNPFFKLRSMKHTISCLCAALLITITTNAQTWHWGPKFDVNYSGMEGNGIKSKFYPGFEVGGFAEYKFSKQFSVQPELLYNWSSYQKADNFMTFYNNYGREEAGQKINLAWVSVPLLLRYNVIKEFAILAGPEYSYLVYDDESLLLEGRPAFKKSEFSVNLGVQANINNVGFYARYNKAVSNTNDVDDRYQWHANHVQVGIAVGIR